MNAVGLETPTASRKPHSRRPSTKAQMNDVTPGSMLGGLRCIGPILTMSPERGTALVGRPTRQLDITSILVHGRGVCGKAATRPLQGLSLGLRRARPLDF